MTPAFLLEEIEARENGVSAAVPVPPSQAPLHAVLGITRVLQHENLDVSIWGAGDSGDWIRLASFHNKCHCGHYTTPISLATHPELKRLRVEWQMSRWGNQPLGAAPLFGFYVTLEERIYKHAGAA